MSEIKSFILKDEEGKKMKDSQSFFRLLRYARPFWKKFIFAFSLMILSATLSIVSARLMGILAEEGLLQRNWSKAWYLAAVILLLEFFSIFCVWKGRRNLSLASSQSLLLIRKTLFNHIHLLPLSYYDHQPEGRTVTRMTHDVEGIEEFFTASLGRLLNSVIIFFIAFIGMLITDFKLGMLLMISLLPAILTLVITRNKIREVNRDISMANSACNAKLSEYLRGISIIRIFGLEDWSKKNYEKVVQRHLDSQIHANHFYAWSRPLTNFFCAFPLLGLVGLGGPQVLAGTLSIGVFITFVRYCERFSHPISALTREIHVIQQAFTSTERVSSFLNAQKEEDVLGADGDFMADNLRGHLIFENVTMGYDDEKIVLSQVDFEIVPGEKIGVAGASGSGKTTAISLLARLYEFQQGNIFLDGRSIREYKRNYLRENLGLVSQDVIIFKGSLRENLTCEAEISDEKVSMALERTGLLKVMESNGWRLESEILDGGANLSVGEKQLISLTRALLKDPSILILDEATSNVDPAYEVMIHQAVDQVMQGRTCLMIAHRLDTLKNCDRILVFREGRLVEVGTHFELMDKKGYFFNLQTNYHSEETIQRA